MSLINMALFMGGSSTEREVSLASGREVFEHLDKKRYRVKSYDPATDLASFAREAADFEVAFPVLHGQLGEDGAMQGFLTMLGLPFVGSGILSSALSMDKRATKDVYRRAVLPVAPDLFLEKNRSAESLAEEALETLGSPVVIKPLTQGSSVGLFIAENKEALVGAINSAWEFGPLLAEKFLPGRELTVAVLGNDKPVALPPIEIIPAEGHVFFDYVAKYQPGQASEICPAALSTKETEKISELALAAHLALGCRGLSRTDFILSGGIFYLLETNTMPGFTTNSLVPKAAAAAGISFSALLDRLVDFALEK